MLFVPLMTLCSTILNWTGIIGLSFKLCQTCPARNLNLSATLCCHCSSVCSLLLAYTSAVIWTGCKYVRGHWGGNGIAFGSDITRISRLLAADYAGTMLTNISPKMYPGCPEYMQHAVYSIKIGLISGEWFWFEPVCPVLIWTCDLNKETNLFTGYKMENANISI